MLDFLLKMNSDYLAAFSEYVKERDLIHQILGGLGPDYNSIIASLTTRENDLSLSSVHSILLTQEQRLNLQQSVPADITSITAHMAAAPSQ